MDFLASVEILSSEVMKIFLLLIKKQVPTQPGGSGKKGKYAFYIYTCISNFETHNALIKNLGH